VQKAFDKQVQLLAANLRHHPSLRAKKYDEACDIWQARVNRNWRFYFTNAGNTCRLNLDFSQGLSEFLRPAKGRALAQPWSFCISVSPRKHQLTTALARLWERGSAQRWVRDSLVLHKENNLMAQ
jgi:hypothetical protein